MVRVRLRVNGDARSGLFIKVGSGTDFPNIHRLREAIGVTLFADPSYGLNIETESVWAAAAIDFYASWLCAYIAAAAPSCPRSRSAASATCPSLPLLRSHAMSVGSWSA